MDNDDEEFLYGDDDDEPTKSSYIAPVSNGIQLDDQDEEEGSEEESDSEDDLEIILDGDTSTAPPQQHRRAHLPVRELPPPILLPTLIVSAEISPPSLITATSTQEDVEPVPQESLIVPAHAALVPHGSLTPYQSPLPPSETNPTLDVNFVAKDANGNDLFDLDIDGLDDKPWRRPGANMADYFNYGMNEPAWKNYAAKQKRTRQELITANNPFAVFAESNITDAWQSLSPEYKSIMMATVMGYQPGMAPPPQMMGMMGMNGGVMSGGSVYGQGTFGGMGNMMYPGGAGGMINNNGFAPRNNIPQGYTAEGIPSNDPDIPGNVTLTANQNFDTSENGFSLMSDLSTNLSVTDNYAAGSMANRGGFVQRGAAGGAIIGGYVPTAPRAASPLPANVPTGPRSHGIPTGPRRPTYQDKDRPIAGNDGLDYGAGGTSGQKDRSPTISRSSRNDRENSPIRSRGGRSRSETVEKDKSSASSRRDRAYESRHQDGPQDEEMHRTSSSSSSRRRRGVDEFFPDKTIKSEEESSIGIKIRGATKTERTVEAAILDDDLGHNGEESYRSSRRNDESSDSRRRRVEKAREQEDLEDAEAARRKQLIKQDLDEGSSTSRRRSDRVDEVAEEDGSSRRSKRSGNDDEKDSRRRGRSGEEEGKLSTRRSSRTEEEQDSSTRRVASSHRSSKGDTVEDENNKSKSRRNEWQDKESEGDREESRLKRRKLEDQDLEGSRSSRTGR